MKAVIIGGSGHFEYALFQPEKVEFVGYAPGSIDEDLSRLESQLNGVQHYPSYLEMLDTLQPDLAVVNPHYYLNAEVVEACLTRNIHCFSEKPLALNPADLAKVQSAHRHSKAKLGTMMVHRYEPWFFAARHAVSSGAIGKVVQLVAQKSYKMGEKPDWMRDKQKFGGIIPWVGAHAIDLIRWLAPGDVQVLGARQTTVGNQGQGDVESSATCLFSFEGGQAVAHIDYLRPENAATHGDDRIRVVGEDGIIEVMNQKALLTSKRSPTEQLPLHNDVGLFEDFLDGVHGKSSGRLTTADAFALTKACIEAEEAAKNMPG